MCRFISSEGPIEEARLRDELGCTRIMFSLSQQLAVWVV